jgi:hypothetical protein
VTGDPIRLMLQARGCPDHVVRGGLDGLVAAWERTATEIERGYPLGWDDYLNDLDGRQIIEDVLRTMPQADGRLATRLRDADRRVRAATRPAGRCVWPPVPGSGREERRGWWYHIVPSSPGAELAGDMLREGFGAPPQ